MRGYWVLTLAFMLIVTSMSVVSADRGMVPPGDVSVYEPGQKAIIGWNGEREVLILSTDVRASENTWVLEFLPLPSRPDSPEAGSFDSFIEVQNIVNDRVVSKYAELGRSMPAGGGLEIIFEKEIGAHDITVVRAISALRLIDFAENLLESKRLTQEVSWSGLEDLAGGYLDRGLNYWVLDIIDLADLERSREPVIYTFESDYLYFPLEITSLAAGETDITLFTLTGEDLDEDSIRSTGLKIKSFAISGEEVPMKFELNGSGLNRISPEVAGLFGGSAQLTVLGYAGSLSNLSGDLMVDHAKGRGLVKKFLLVAIVVAIALVEVAVWYWIRVRARKS